MSDAPRSSDSGKPELDPPPRHAGLRLSEVSTMAAAHVGDLGDSPPAVPLSEGFAEHSTSSPTPSLPPLRPADHVNGAGSLLSASETSHSDGPPLLGAGFSNLDAPTPVLPQPPDAVEPAGADTHGASQPEAETSVAADPPVDVSHILSALDAAEQRAQGTKPWSEMPERGPAEQVHPRVEPPEFSTSRSRGESRPRIELPPERRLFGFNNVTPLPMPRDWETEVEELPPPQVTAAGSVQARELSSPPGMMREGLAELPVGPAADALDAAAKIAAEASAAAEALENLKRLLGSRAPNIEVTPPPVVTAPPLPPVERHVERSVERHEPVVVPPPIVAARPLPPPMPLPNQRSMVLAELPPPMPMDFERDQNVGVVLRGFLVGLGLSLAAGVVLYFFMSAG